MRTHTTLFLLILGTALGLAVAPAPAHAQSTGATDEAPADGGDQPASSSEAPPESFFFSETTVTATGTEIDSFEVSTPVTVFDRRTLDERMPENAAELLRSEPGVDVNGVGPNQSRPVIRGQRGLRVLFMENGLRMNNARRQSDFGEIPGLVDVDSVEVVEVVRGPASVLYGSDAIGGVLNLIARGPVFGGGLTGHAGARYGSAGDGWKASAAVARGGDDLSFEVGVTRRDVDDYDAASGSFGEIRLDDGATVIDSGLEDDSLFGHVAYSLGSASQIGLRLNRYRADATGFGFVDPTLIDANDPFRIRILYPFQDFDRWTLSYIGAGLESPLTDTIEVQAYHQSNDRQLANDIDISIPGRPGVPGVLVEADSLNFTDLDTMGLRLEVVTGVANRHLLTYGAEFYEDDSFNTDRSTTTTSLVFPGPPGTIPVGVVTDDVANAPNAENSSGGLFAQIELAPSESWKVTVGGRYQDVATRAQATPGWEVGGLDFDDHSLVGAVSALYRVSDSLRLVGSFGTAFRAPNIVERLFNGPTPEGAGFQILNPDLVSEESENIDLGLKYRRRNVLFDLTFFRNDIDDGIIQDFLSPAEVAMLPAELQARIAASQASFVVRQVNADRLRFEGVEMRIDYRSDGGWSVGGNYTHISDERIDSLNPPTGDLFADKYNAYFRWEPELERFWAELRVRHNGDTPANLQMGDPVPVVGAVLPSFTVSTLSGGYVFGGAGARHELIAVIDNLTDELYSEFSNATFFRPEPERSFTLSYRFRY